MAFHAFHTLSFPWPCFGDERQKITITAKAHLGNGNRLSELATIVQVDGCAGKRAQWAE